MKNGNELADGALAAMGRAARDAWRRAAMYGLDVPIWQDGKIVYVDPAELLAGDPGGPARRSDIADA